MSSSTESLTHTLVRAAQSGDQEAFARLYQDYGPLVLRTAYLLLSDTGRAEDVTQEVFVRLYRNLHRYRPERGAFATWLHRITVHACLSAQRRRLLPWISMERAYVDGGVPALSSTPLELALRNEEQQHIWQAVQQLPFTLRAAIVLRYYQGLSYQEVANVMDCPVGTIRSRLHTAHARLRNELEDER